MITGHEIGPTELAEVTETVPEVKELPEVVPESERLPEATDGPTVAEIREAVPAETDGLTAAEIQERMELTAADVNWKAREAERRKLLEAGAKAGMDHKVATVLRDMNENKSEMQRKRRLRKARLVRKIQGWLIGCWPENDEEARVGCGRCEYRARKDGDGSGGDVAETELAGCEGVEEAMVPLAMLEDLRELLKLVREDMTK